MGTAESKEGRNNSATAWTLAALIARSGVTTIPPTFPDLPISSLTDDSRKVIPGSCFVAVRGVGVDGHDFIEAAVHKGAAVVVGEREIGALKSDPPRSLLSKEGWEASPAQATGQPSHNMGVVYVRVADSREALSRLAASWYGLDSAGLSCRKALAGTQPLASTSGNRSLTVAALKGDGGGIRLIGVTGTNGKTTVTWLLRSILNAAGNQAAVLGTVEYDLVSRRCAAPLTTPGSLDLCQYLAEARDGGAQFAAMEVSSHALDQRRTDGLPFAAAVFTNLTGDHLDYHGSMEAYFAAKRRLFKGLRPPAKAIINADDPRATELINACPVDAVTFGLRAENADVRATVVRSDRRGVEFIVHAPWFARSEFRVRFGLVGEHNVSNALAAATTAMALGIKPDAIRRGLEETRGVPGRLERVESRECPFSVFVDYAHTDDALRNVLQAVRPITSGRVLCVFGCGGDRDKTKRPRMAAVAEELADVVFVTSDNPRKEDPDAIIEDILAGFTASHGHHASPGAPGEAYRGRLRTDELEILRSPRRLQNDGGLAPLPAQDGKNVFVDVDRRNAIAAAVAAARPGDTVLIAGKGHENYQLVGDQVLPFDDVAVARACLANLTSNVPQEVVA